MRRRIRLTGAADGPGAAAHHARRRSGDIVPSFARRAAAAFLLACVLAGCGGAGSGGPAADLMKAGRYDEAVAALETAVTARPSDARLARNLGIARLHNGDARGAVDALTRALTLRADDPATLFFLGRARETAGDPAGAAAAYASYLERKPDDAEVRTRLRTVNLERIRRDIESAVQGEAQRSSEVPDNTLAVMAFQNLSGAAEVDALSRGLQAMISGDLAMVKQFTVLERERINILIEEVKLASSTVDVKPEAPAHPVDSVEGVKERLALLPGRDGRPYFQGTDFDGSTGVRYMDAVRAFQGDQGLSVDGRVGPQTQAALSRAFDDWFATGSMSVPAMDPSSVPRAGRLLGAGLLVQGTLSGSLSGALRLDAGVTESTTGALKGPGADATGPLDEILRLEKEIVFGLLDGLSIRLSDAERDAIGRLPTKNSEAFLAWSEGLLFEDRDRMDLARGAYSRALALDPGFLPARRSLDAVSGTDAGFSRTQSRLADEALAQGGAGGGDDALRSRLDRIGTVNGGGLPAGRGGGDDLDPSVTPVGVVGGSGTIIVTGDVPR